MTSTVPPFPVSGSPHADIEMRELYARLGHVERRIGKAEGDSEPLSFKVSGAKLVLLDNKTVRHGEGWYEGTVGGEASGPAVLLGNLKAPGVVLSLTAYLLEEFSPSLGGSHYLLVTDVYGHEGLPIAPRFWAYVEAGLTGIEALSYIGQSLAMREDSMMPGPSGDSWRNIGVLHNGRESWGRGVPPIPEWVPIVVGFAWGRQPAGTVGEPAEPVGIDYQGALHVIVVYVEGMHKKEIVPLSITTAHKLVLFSEIGVRAA